MKRPLCCVCMAFVVTVFIYLKLNPLPDAQLAVPEGSRVTFLGEVYQKEYRGDKHILYLTHIREYDFNTKNAAITETEGIMCYMEADEAYIEPKLGSIVVVEGEAAAFREVRNYGGFDARQYYKILGLDFQTYNTKLLAVSDTHSEYKERLYQLRRYFEGIFDKVLSDRDASIMKAMVLGNKAELDAESKLLYQQSGISHVFAISGLHITLIGMGLYRLLRKMRLPTAAAAVISIIVMLAYGEMAGMSSSAFRAIFMFSLKMLAQMLHRTYDMLNALAVAAVLLLVEQPLYLYHTGFLLSFGAILGVCCVSRAIKGLGIFLVHFPIMLCAYYEFPIYSFLLNMIVIPSMTVLMGLGLFCLACGSIPIEPAAVGMAKLCGLGCHLIIEAFEWLSSMSLKLPNASWIVGRPDDWRIYCFYGTVLTLCLAHEYCEKVNKNDKCVSLEMRISVPHVIKLILVVAAAALISSRPADGLKIAFLDVGQGDCIWLEMPSGEHYLIDAGSSSDRELEKYTLTPYLKYMGTARLEAVFLTHLDNDHISGILDMLEDGSIIRIDKLIISDAAIQDDIYYELVQLCGNNDISLLSVSTGDMLEIGNAVTLEVIHPAYDYEASSRNAYSLVMRLDYESGAGSFSALFTGDVEADGEAEAAKYLSERGSTCQLYKVSHHGSRSSNTEAILQAAMPKLAVISCGENNSYGHPHEEVLKALENIGCKTLVTKDTGGITVWVKNGEVRVTTVLEKQ